MRVKQMNIKGGMSALEIIEEMAGAGVFIAGRLARAVRVLSEMIGNEDVTVFFGAAGALVPAGLGRIIAEMIYDGFVDVVVTTGANITHDLIEAFGGAHVKDIKGEDDKLREKGVNRIFDSYVSDDAFVVFEKRIQEILMDIPVEKREKGIPVYELLREVGLRVNYKHSFVKAAAETGVPIFCPAITDSILGLQMWLFSQKNALRLDVLEDLHKIVSMAYESKKAGAFILGGGVPKNHILQAMLLTGRGFDYAVQITLDRPESGGLSGATLSEAKSWGKVAKNAVTVDVIADVTITLPLIFSALKEILGGKKTTTD
ncbi:MAG: deoxyhypusine synthase [Candidatus Jordarchaeales archaeon]|nr:deoxyhypusine synthase [Candidatus Jordarchaeia archaeon]